MASVSHNAKPLLPTVLPWGAKIGVAAALMIASLGAAASPAPLHVALSGLALALVILLLWRPREPPILLLPALFQWSEVALVPISTIWKQIELNDLSSFGSDLESSALYGLLGVVSLSVGLRLAMGRRPEMNEYIKDEVGRLAFPRVGRLALALMGAGYLFAATSSVAGPAREMFHNLSGVKNVGLFILAFWCLHRKEKMGLMAGVILLEILIGMTGFFAGFKNSLLTLIVAAIAARFRWQGRDAVVVAAAVFVLIAVATFWSAIKPDYREFMNQGTREQVVLVPMADRLGYLADKVGTIRLDEFGEGFDSLVNRHGYIDYLARTMETVPEVRPYENGALTVSVLQHVTMPRVLFPTKPPLPSDTEIMARYTGQQMLWGSETSISIGHLAEMYVDFGYRGGLVVEFFIGLFVGIVYKTLQASRQIPVLVRLGLGVMVALPLAYFGTAYAKLVGSLLLTTAIALLLPRVVPKLFFSASVGRRQMS